MVIYEGSLVDSNETLVKIPNHVDAKKSSDRAFVLDFDVLGQLVVEGFAVLMRPKNYDIVNVNSNEEMRDLDAGIGLQCDEPKFCNNSTEEEIPNSRRLFDPIDGLVEMKDFVRELIANKAFSLVNIDVHVAFSIQEGVLTINMQDVTVVCSSNCQDDADGVHPDDGSKGFVEVQAGYLGVALCNDTCLVLGKVD
jgi:hypothetical protein